MRRSTIDTAVRPAAVAGSFYPQGAAQLAATVASCLRGARSAAGGVAPKLLLVPHAGFAYSGPVAGSTYALLAPWRERFHRVVLLGPGHRVALRGLAAPRAEAFATPLGEVAVAPPISCSPSSGR
jgi:AmmeMemoRadiSam system protein B